MRSTGTGKIRHQAQILFLASGALATVLYSGAPSWAQGILGILIATACAMEAMNRTPEEIPHPWWLLAPLLLLGGWLLGTLLPWPTGWVAHLAPGQARLLADLDGFRPRFLHLSMAVTETRGAFFILLGCGLVFGLSWLWSADRSFRLRLTAMLFLLGVGAAFLGFMDRVPRIDLLPWGRPVGQTDHWGVFTNRNHLASFSNMSALVGLGMMIRCLFPRNAHHRRPFQAFLLFVGIGFCVAMSAATASKGALVSFVAGLLLFMLMISFRKRSRAAIWLIFCGMVAGSGLLMAFGRPLLQRTEAFIENQKETISDGRWQIWKDAWNMGKKMEGRGIGVGGFETVFPAYQTREGHKTFTHAENDYLQAWVEWGIPGAIGWLWLGVLIARAAFHTRLRHASEWQMAGWSALFALGVHSAMDFPIHRPAVAWFAMALLGMLVRGHSVEKSEKDSFLLERRHPILLSLSFILLIGSLWIYFPGGSSVRRMEEALQRGDLSRIRKEDFHALDEWPFYWRIHELTGYVAAAFPGGSEVAKKEIQRAQRLAQVNPLISYHAGMLFFNSNPRLGVEFFEQALWIASEPRPLFYEMMRWASKQPTGVRIMLPLAMQDPMRWTKIREYIDPRQMPILWNAWIHGGVGRWLNEPAARDQVLGPLVRDGRGSEALKSLSQLPPRNPRERYWQAVALLEAGKAQDAAGIFRALWSEIAPSPPPFKGETADASWLAQARREPSNMELQRQVGESLMASGRYAEAIPIWQHLLEGNLEPERTRYALALAYERMGDWSKAAATWRSLAETRLPWDI